MIKKLIKRIKLVFKRHDFVSYCKKEFGITPTKMQIKLFDMIFMNHYVAIMNGRRTGMSTAKKMIMFYWTDRGMK